MTTPATVLEQLTTDHPQSPRLTCFDDQRTERIELSGAVLVNWISKAANVLQEEFDVEPGSIVAIDLPTGHWRTLYWALAAWAVGASVALDAHEGADVLVTTSPASHLRTVVGTWAAGGSVVTVVGDGPVDPTEARMIDEGVTGVVPTE